MRIPLTQTARDSAIAYLAGTLPPQPGFVAIQYRTRTGALLRVDGTVAGAYDREHHEVVLPPADTDRALALEVEVWSLPTTGLPSGPGIVWWYLNARAHEDPATFLSIAQAPRPESVAPASAGTVQAVGHSHLDVAWLWTYEQTRRKAARTFAIACDLLDRDASFRFVQSQPQLYRFVQESDAGLFERVQAFIETGRFDPLVAALWVESDCNIPSGESLLRQLLYAHEYCAAHLRTAPSIAWLPDSFGFARTLPQLLAHAGVRYFATTKLQWNDTTRFPYPQFVWEGPDGSSVIGAIIQSYDGPPYPWRVHTAKQRKEPLIVGYGDGGGGVTPKMLDQVAHLGRWIRVSDWFDGLQERRAQLPVHRDELYLEYHRGVYTTHHDVKMHNALLERSLLEGEELLAWCIAVHAPKAGTLELADALHSAWEIVLRNQFHDVLPGTSIAAVYEDVREEFAQAEERVARVIASAQSMLPRTRDSSRAQERSEPYETAGLFVFDNGLVQAKIHRSGTLVDLCVKGGRNVCTRGNVLTLYRDTPKAWEAWNIDREYAQRGRSVRACGARIADGGVQLEYLLGRSPASMRITLAAGEPFLRVELDLDWSERRRLLRIENALPIDAAIATYGAPHGVVQRSTLERSPAERAKFEVPGQRFAAVQDDRGAGVAIFALDTYGWNARRTRDGIAFGHSLLRGTTWPDPDADLGEQHFSYAFAPFSGASTGMLERAWIGFAHEPRVRLFVADSDSVLVVACKPAHDADGVIVRVRECDGQPVTVRVRCAARMTGAHRVDGLERSRGERVEIEQEHLILWLRPFEICSVRVRFSHAA